MHKIGKFQCRSENNKNLDFKFRNFMDTLYIIAKMEKFPCRYSKNGEFSVQVLKQQIHKTSEQEYYRIVALKTPFTRR